MALRAAVAVMVVLHHLPVQLERLGYVGHWGSLFASRVDIFFVISGFLIWVSTNGRRQTASEFLYRRLARIVPLYWLMTALVVAVMLVTPSCVQSGRFDPSHILASLMFVPWSNPVAGYPAPVIIPGWTLNYEMFFYVLFALCLPLQSRARLLTVTAIFGLLALSRPFASGLGVVADVYTSSILLEFSLGMAVGAAYSSGRRLTSSQSVVLGSLGLAALVLAPEAATNPLPRLLAYGVPASLLLAGLVSYERDHALPVVSPALKVLGDATYAIFLTHGMVLSLLGQFWRSSGIAGLPGSTPAFVIVAVFYSIAVGIAVNRGIEAPITSRLLGHRRRGPAATGPIAAAIFVR